jgi:tripartite-type tricarboxylate transporter receptor subunit TctC
LSTTFRSKLRPEVGLTIHQHHPKSAAMQGMTPSAHNERLSSAPDVPTLTESGIPIVAFAWLGICAGSGTPQPIIELLNSKLVPILNSEEYRSLMSKSGSVPTSSTPQGMQVVINETVKDAAPLIEEFDLYLD